MKKNIYLVRHGESIENESGILAGASAALTEKGRKEAEFIGRRLAKLQPDVLIASHYKRAQETAEIVGDIVDLPVETHDFLFENLYPSRHLGKHYRAPDVVAEALAIHEKYVDENYKDEDAESFAEIKERGRRALELLRAHPGENIVVISHGLFIRFLVGYMLFGERYTSREYVELLHGLLTKNTGITWCTHDEKAIRKPWRIVTWNDHNHLADA